jgi:hypothetical protein
VWGDHTEARHPEIVADFLQNELFPNFKRVFGGNIGDEGELDFLLTHSILPLRHHMGQWGPSGVKPTDDILGPAALIIQEADFYSTRGFLGEFDESKWDEVLRRNSPAEIHREPK